MKDTRKHRQCNTFIALISKAFLEVDRVQPDASDGLVFLIEIVNDAEETIDLTNPFDLTAATLFTYDGNRRLQVNLPPVPPDHALCRKDGWIAEPGRTVRQKKDARRPFMLVDPQPDEPGTKGVIDIKDGKVSLASGQHFIMLLKVTRTIGDPNGYYQERRSMVERPDGRRSLRVRRGRRFLDPTEIAPISPGEYRLRLTLALLTADGKFRDVTTGRKRSELIPIHLGVNSDPPE